MLKPIKLPLNLSQSKLRTGLEAKLVHSTTKVTGFLKNNKMSSQKQLESLPIDIKPNLSKLSSQSTKLLSTVEQVTSNTNQEKLQNAIEKKFEESSMKRYRFPTRELDEELTAEQSLNSLKEVQVYNLHSQNKRETFKLQTTPTLIQYKTHRTEKTKLNLHSEYSNTKFTKTFKDPSRPRLTTPGESTDKLQSLLKKLSIHKDVLRDFSSSMGRVHTKETSVGAGTLKRNFGETLPSNKQAILLKYLKASRAKMENFKQKYLPDPTRPSLLDFKRSLLCRPSASRERNSSLSGKSFGQTFRNRQETSADKFKNLRLSCLGTSKQSPESKMKNSKTFKFATSASSRPSTDQHTHDQPTPAPYPARGLTPASGVCGPGTTHQYQAAKSRSPATGLVSHRDGVRPGRPGGLAQTGRDRNKRSHFRSLAE